MAGVSHPRRDPAYPPAFRIYTGLLIAGSLAIVPHGVALAARTPIDAVIWAAFIAMASLLVVPMLPKVQVDASLGAPVSVAAAVILAPPLAFLVNLVGFTNQREIRGRASPWAVAFNRTQAALAAGAASFAALFVDHRIAATIVAVLVYNLVNTAAVTVALWSLHRLRLPEAARESTAPFPRFAVDYGLVALMAAFVVAAFDTVGLWGVALLALPLALGYSALQSARVAQDRAEQLAARVADLETLNGLAADLLTVRDRKQVLRKGREALVHALSSEDVDVRFTGDGGEDDLRIVPILVAEPATVRVPRDLSDSSMAVVEAIAGLIGMALQRLELEHELSEVERARAALSGRILEEGTRERSRIALEIHDEVLPYLAAAGIQADNVRSALTAGDQAAADRLADLARRAVHDGIVRLRQVLDALQRQIVVPGGLRPGLEDALEELRLKHGVEGALQAPQPLPPLPLAVEILVLETIRGCLANVAQHARAEFVGVDVAVDDRHIVVRVQDDGCGFDRTAVGPGSNGLALMEQRVELARGRFVVDSAPGVGTTVQVEVPV